MSLLAALALAASAPQPAPRDSVRPLVQATATVRILSGVRVPLDGSPSADLPRLRDSVIRGETGSQAVRLIEFE
jgi:hypothetical protein